MTLLDGETTPAAIHKYVGTRPIRHDGMDKVIGKARYGADEVLPGMLEGAFLRSPHAHARILSIDTSRAVEIPGVKAIVTGGDFPRLSLDHPEETLSQNLMARDKVFYDGHPIAAVAATSSKIAREAVRAIDVEYEVLPHVLTVDEAMADGAPVLHEHLRTKNPATQNDAPTNVHNRTFFEKGDIDAGFADAHIDIERTFTTKVVHQGYIEPHAAVADTGQDGRSTIWCSSQGHFKVRAMTASLLGWEPSRIKVIPAEIGGGFGGKTNIYLEPIAVLLSQKSGRPVRLVMSRDEVFRSTGPTPGAKAVIRIGADSDGKITAAKANLVFESGAFPGPWAMIACLTCWSAYDIDNAQVEGFDVVVNKPRAIPYRAPGSPQAAFGVESVMDEIARGLEIDPLELRLRNAATKGTRTLHGVELPIIGAVDTLEAVRSTEHYTLPLGPNQGRGVAIGYWGNMGAASSATVNLNEDGTVVVVTGSPDIGGSRASMALMAAEEFGIDVYQIQPVVGDTESVGFTDVTEGSRATFATGMAVVEASRKVVAVLCQRAAQMWNTDVDTVSWLDGEAHHFSNDEHESLSLQQITRQAHSTGGPIGETASVNAAGAGPAYATHVCDVEVDPGTGQVTVLRYTTAQDAGTAIHPSYVEGQMQGGVVQGIGWALNEEYIHNGQGILENPSFLDYRIPVASDLPMIETIIVEVPNPNHPYGVRGVGEVGIVPPLAAIANAIRDAIGERLYDLPMSPPKILEVITETK